MTMTKNFLLCLLIISATILFFCWSGWESVYAEKIPEHVGVVFLIDDSGSMGENDRADLRYTAVRLFVSLLSGGDAVAAIRFADDSALILPESVEISRSQSKISIVESIQPVIADGYTNVLAAIQLADQTLDNGLFEHRKTIVILLTDGKPEIERPYATYEQEALQAAEDLGVPIYSIALTPEGQTSFLGELAQVTQGKVIPAKTANDLLDSYLQILGELKDRTVIGTDEIDEDLVATIHLDAGLTPYIQQVTFIACQDNLEHIQLINPGGQVVFVDDPGVAFYLDGDPRFIALSLLNPASGDWQFQFSQDQPVQVRAILHTSLRTRLVSPEGLHPMEKPFLITVEMVEEMPGSQVVKIIGDANFSVDIHRPDGTRESLDALFDDGSHGDAVAGDGLFSREYPDTNLSGVYQISILGTKGVVPVQSFGSVEVIPFPELDILEPIKKEYLVRDDLIPLEIGINGDANPDWLEGDIQAVITTPFSQEETIPLARNTGTFQGKYQPKEDGEYQVIYVLDALSYRGLPIYQELKTSFSVKRIGTLIVQDVIVGDNTGPGPYRAELPQNNLGIPVTIRVDSALSEDSSIRVHLENLPEFSLDAQGPFDIFASSTFERTLYLRSKSGFAAGSWQGELVFSSTDQVDLSNARQSVEFELFIPTITLKPSVSLSKSSGCLRPYSLQVQVETTSNNQTTEDIPFYVYLGDDQIETFVISVPPGASQFEHVLQLPENRHTGDIEIRLVASSQRPGLMLDPSNVYDIQITIPGLWNTCQQPIIFLGSGLTLGCIIIIRLIRKIRKRSQPALVTGTLITWHIKQPENTKDVDLTALERTQITIGSSSQCDVIIQDKEIAEEHCLIIAEKQAENEHRLIIKPIEKVRKGYREFHDPMPLEENASYQIGNHQFKFIQDLHF